jgi:hypothetical protein
MKQSGKSCYQFAIPTEDGNPSASGPSPIDSPNTSSAGGWQPVASASLTSPTPSPAATEFTVTSHNLPQTFSPISLSHPSTASLNYSPMADMLFSTQATSSEESHSTMSLLTLTSAVTFAEDTHASTTEEEATTPLRAPSSVETSTKDHTQSSQSVHQIQTAKPEATTGTNSSILGLSQYATQSYETTASVSTTSQKSETQYDASEQSTTLRDDSPDFSTEATSPAPVASTGKLERGVTSAQKRCKRRGICIMCIQMVGEISGVVSPHQKGKNVIPVYFRKNLVV